MVKKKVKFTKETVGLSLILLLSAVLNFANLRIEGYANTYYAAGVKSMMMNFKNFFFVSSDPSGFVTIDKPPLGFWIQTIFAKIFGFNGWSIILPQAIAGVISVWIMYYLIKRSFGSLSGLIAALCLAVTPMFVAASRNNTIDNLLVLALLLACLALSIAAEKGKLKYLIISLVLVGIGFNIKMVEAYMVAPALYITYLLGAAIPFKKRIKHLIVGSIILLLVSLSWALVVDMIPAANRPFVGSSTNNSVMELIIGHNGLERIGLGSKLRFGGKNNLKNQKQRMNPGQVSRNLSKGNTQAMAQGQTTAKFQKGNNQGQFRNRFNIEKRNMKNINIGGFGMGNSSQAGIARLFSNNNLSDQVSWLLPLALFGFLAGAIKEKLKAPFDNRRKLDLILWITWLVPEYIYFSFTKGSFHTYYLTTMAPSIAALVGIGLTAMWEFYKKGGWKTWLLPVAFIVNGATEILILSYNYRISSGYKIIMVLTAILCFASSIILAVINLTNKGREINSESVDKEIYEDAYKSHKDTNLNKILVSISLIGVLIAPTVWSFTPMFYKMNGGSPSAGLELSRSNQREFFGTTNNSKLISFLEANKTNEKYLVAVPSAMTYASDLILKTGEPVMTIGGFSGSDKIITVDQFKQLVDSGAIRYALASGGAGRGGFMGGGFMGGGSNSDITNWIEKNGKVVPSSEWQNSTNSNNGGYGGFRGRNYIQLYDLKSNTK
jgi:4-amino-4-deoxy-L-arabinose transferase-like glycosyltransferase